ncbi:zf-TFIIB domain-containing protein [Arthrobacter sp. UYEF21]|uniref:TFIIB-type zinc ribbon-containing protein n=1 Tax=Arthrobacter sp. UYEF21 TaxID=1756364 RepID=UPI003396CD39
MSERSGVEIDYRPQCRGVWLDRGELDKIIDRANATMGASAPAAPRAASSRGPTRRRTTSGARMTTNTASRNMTATTTAGSPRRRKGG